MLFIHDVKCLQLEEERRFKEELKLQQHIKRLNQAQNKVGSFCFFAFACRYGPEIDYVADEVSQE